MLAAAAAAASSLPTVPSAASAAARAGNFLLVAAAQQRGSEMTRKRSRVAARVNLGQGGTDGRAAPAPTTSYTAPLSVPCEDGCSAAIGAAHADPAGNSSEAVPPQHPYPVVYRCEFTAMLRTLLILSLCCG